MNYQNRITKLRQEIKEQNLDAILISDVPNILYFTGFSNFSKEEREGYLIVTKKNSYIITDTLYSEAVDKEVSHCKLLVKTSSEPFLVLLKNLIKKEKILSLCFEENDISVSEFKLIRKAFPRTSMLRSIQVAELREIKEDNEIELIQKACQIGDAAFDFILGKIKPGISEKELAWELEKFIKDQKAELSFSTIVAFGPNSSVPHHQTSDKRLQPKSDRSLSETNENIILIDFGVKYKNYCSDMTRTVFFGKANTEQKKM